MAVAPGVAGQVSVDPYSPWKQAARVTAAGPLTSARTSWCGKPFAVLTTS